jgi:protein-disulfide isomerase
VAQEQGTAPSSLPSIQEQLEQLRQGQALILQELESIKARLAESPVRNEYGAKPAVTTNLISLNVHGEPFRGDSKARVAIMEYSDFACSFCARYTREIYPRIQQQYVDKGKVRYYFRDLPAPEHTNSLLLARAARCAGLQGKFWEMHDQLFAMQLEHDTAALEACAEAIGLDRVGFNECLESDRFADNIRRSMLSAKRIGVYGTPALILGKLDETGDFLRSTQLLVGTENYENIAAALDQLLNPAPERKTLTP